jgi:hypothetical protein
MSRYKRKYLSNRSIDVIVPFFSSPFCCTAICIGYTNYSRVYWIIFLAITSGLVIYWVRELKKMIRVEYSKPVQKDIEGKGWFYDLIKKQ